jgi:hypothetical protein
MNKLALHTAALTLAALPFASAPVMAQEPAAQRVEIAGTRYDVHAMCPAVEDDLRTQLARRLRMLPDQALVQVAFHIDGRSIEAVQTSGSTHDARKAIRQAVHQIRCDNAGAGRQRVRFDVSYRWHDGSHAAQPAAGGAAPVRVAVAAR